MLSSLFRVVFWVVVDIVLIAFILLVLEYFNIWSGKEYLSFFFDEGLATQSKALESQNPLLLKNEELKKWEEGLKVREQVLRVREAALQEVQVHHQELLFQLKQKTDQLNTRIEKFNDESKNKKDSQVQLQDIAKKLTSMPPANAVNILEGLNTLLVIDILNQIDKDALLAGEDSMSPFLLSQMSIKKAQEIVRLKDTFPVEAERSESIQMVQSENPETQGSQSIE